MTEIPDWCPKPIADKAHELLRLHHASPTVVDLIEHLATDPRMKRVWHELGKQSRVNHRRTGEPFYKLTGQFASIGHDNALAGLFERAITIGRLTLMPLSADHPVRPYQALADRLEGEAGQLCKPRIDQKTATQIARQLLLVAVHCEAVTVAVDNPDKRIAVEIAAWLNAVFESRNYNYTITAIITNVITGHAVTDRKVRTWLSDPAK